MLETARIRLDVVTLEDAQDMFEYCSNKHTMRYERSEFTDIKDLENMLTWFIENKGLFVIRLKNSNRVIGHITLTPTTPRFFNEYNLGYILHEDYQGFGYCTEACKVIMKYAFETLDIHRIRAACNPDNIASWKVMEKLGLQKEAHFKKRACFRNDEDGNPIYTDEFVYALNVEDYTNMHMV